MWWFENLNELVEKFKKSKQKEKLKCDVAVQILIST